MSRIAVQMYTLRTLYLPLDEAPMSLGEVLREVAAAGYDGIETFGALEPPAQEVAGLLKELNLRVCSAHVAIELLQEELDRVVEYHRALGNQTLIVPWLAPEQRPTDAAGWQQVGRSLDALGARIRAAGARLLYHNHDFEMEEVEGRTALEWMLAGADPAHLGAELDIGWVVRAGVEPVALLQRLSGRVPRIHVKDVAPPGENLDEAGDADVGQGTVEWDAVLPAARAAGVEWLVVEHDQPHYPLQTLGAGASYLSGRWE